MRKHGGSFFAMLLAGVVKASSYRRGRHLFDVDADIVLHKYYEIYAKGRMIQMLNILDNA